jgi:hypothetical protein
MICGMYWLTDLRIKSIGFGIAGMVTFSMLTLLSCASETEQKGKPETTEHIFELLDESRTGVGFSNDLSYDNEFNVYKYRNYYNGGGVALGDINNDGLLDIYFTSNQQKNRLYLNQGDFRFKDITDSAHVGGAKPWSTGVSMADINGDGFIDIYVCNSGDLKGENKQNELFINQGDGTFKELADEYNLADKGFSTHSAFFDYDKDGDLDVYILNNSYQAIGSFNLNRNERHKRDQLGGDKLMENVNGEFIDVSEKAGIYGSVIGFGLGVSVGDMNNDGWEDIYVSNDFFERDYLYINRRDGTFSEELEQQITSISGASMGADVADINNDGYNDIFVTEMLPSDYDRLKSVTTFEDWNKYKLKVNSGYYHQYTRNTLQLNNTNNSFSEIGRLSGVEASDWSWGALLFDMDNDGLKDLFIANGVYKDLTDQDYLNYISNEEILKSILSEKKIDYSKLIDIIPSHKLKNHAYKNLGGLKFETYTSSGLQTESFSNGSAYGDLDNDGDMDLVVNNLNMKSFVYRNNSMDNGETHFLKFVLKGEGKNSDAIGARAEVGSSHFSIENQPVRGFQSSVDVRPNFGLPSTKPQSVKVIWPSGKVTTLDHVPVDQILVLSESEGKFPEVGSSAVKKNLFNRNLNKVAYRHRENPFVDFDRERLLYHMGSTEGPKMSRGDVNSDGYNDLFIGGSKGSEPVLLLGTKNGYVPKRIADFEKNSDSEDAGNVFFDADNDGDLDIYVCSGGVEYSQYSSSFLDRLYINDGNGNFRLSDQKLPVPDSFYSTSTAIASDIDNDGDLDLFVGQRIIPLKYGTDCSGFILRNNGSGIFTDVTKTIAPSLQNIGMITDALFQDLDRDGDEDLIVVGEFMGIEMFTNENGNFTRKEDNGLSEFKGWWNTIENADLDNDGDLDLIVGNHGLNSRFKASKERPITLYSEDFDNNGFMDPILSFRGEKGKDYPYSLRHDLTGQIKNLTKKYPDYQSFKNASITDIFTQDQLAGANRLEVNTLASIILINEGNFSFQLQELPVEAQFSTIYAISTEDFDNDGDQDIVLGGNLYNVKPEAGRYDASYGVFLENLGQMNFKSSEDGSGFSVSGEIRDMVIDAHRLIVARNNDSLAIFNY